MVAVASQDALNELVLLAATFFESKDSAYSLKLLPP
jgi:hypothetical protein